MTDKPKKSVTAYLDSLIWDRKPRLSRWLVDYAGAKDTPIAQAICRAILIGAVRRARSPGCKIDEILILEGPQGSGKSIALRVLAVEDDWFTDDFPFNAGSDQFMEATAGKWIVELSELKAMSSGDAAALKACLSRPYDTTSRKPYAREGARIPRQFVIVGTTAASDYLRDTGSRRYWSVQIEHFDIDRLRADRDQLWAEAAVAEAADESTRIEQNLINAQATLKAEHGTVPFLADRQRYSLRCLRDFARPRLASAASDDQNRCESGLAWLDDLLDGSGSAEISLVDQRIEHVEGPRGVADARRAELLHAARVQLDRTHPVDGHLHADHLARLILAFLEEEEP